MARKEKWDLLFTCCWYNRQADGLYKFGVLDAEPVSLDVVACPVALELVPLQLNKYKIPADQSPLLEEARRELAKEAQS